MPLEKSDIFITQKNTEEIDKKPISVLQPHGPLFFGSIEYLIDTYSNATEHRFLIIDMSFITMIDLSGVYALEDLIKNLKLKNIKVFVLNESDKIKKILKKIDFINNIGKECYIDSKDSIIAVLKKIQKL